MDFDATRQLLIKYIVLCIRYILQKKWEYNKAVHYLFTDFKQAVRRKVLYNILIKFGICM